MEQLDQNHLPLISVIMPTYNYGRFIEAAIHCLQNQTYPKWECIVVDDGSTDDTKEVVQRLAQNDARLRYIHQENQRQGAAKNTGIAACSGEFVQFLDSDDLIESQKLEMHVRYLVENASIDIVYGDLRYFDEDGSGELRRTMFGEEKSWIPYTSGLGEEILRQFVIHNALPINAALVRRALVNEIGEFDPRLPPYEDWDYWLRCVLAGKSFQFAEQEGTMALVRAHPTSSSRQKPSVIAAERLLRQKLNEMLPSGELRKLNREMAARFEGTLGLEAVDDGKRWAGLRQFLRAARTSSEARIRLRWLACALSSLIGSTSLIETVAMFSPAQSWARLRHRQSAK